MATSKCVIQDLIARSLSTRSFAEKSNIIKNGKPTPELPNLIQQYKAFTRHFPVNSYEKHDWLAGSTELNAVFCWNCLLFANDKNTSWTKTGFSHLGNLSKSLAGHETTVGHLRASVSLARFGELRIETALDAQLENEISEHNRKVRQNREILKRLINAVCFLGKQELSFRGHDESDSSINRGNYVELLKYTAEYDPLLANHLETASVYKGISNRTQNELIDAIAASLLEEINLELKASNFVAVLVDETTDVSNKAQMSVVLRYLNEGEVKERLIGFKDVSSDRRAPAIAELMRQSLTEFEINDKLVAQSFDGAATMAGCLNGVQALIKETHPEALFIHCYAHVLNLVLSQSVSIIPECKVFFNTLSRLAAFFTRSPKWAKFLDEFLKRRLSRVSPTRWNYSSRLVNTVSRNRSQLCDVFTAMLNNPEEVENDILSPTSGFLSSLEDFKFCFFLNVFDKIFAFTDVLFSILQKQSFDIIYCRKKITETQHHIMNLRENFDEIYQETVSDVGEPSKRRNINFRRIFYEIFDNVSTHLEARFQDHSNLHFLGLLSKEKYQDYSKTFPENEFISLLKSYGKHFDTIRLRNELIVLYSTSEFHQNKNCFELAKLLNSSPGLSSSFPQTALLVQLICTIPVSTATVERSFSALKRIKTYSRNTTGERRLTNLAVISIESRLLEKIKQSETFFDRTVTFYTGKERRMDFQLR